MNIVDLVKNLRNLQLKITEVLDKIYYLEVDEPEKLDLPDGFGVTEEEAVRLTNLIDQRLDYKAQELDKYNKTLEPIYELSEICGSVIEASDQFHQYVVSHRKVVETDINKLHWHKERITQEQTERPTIQDWAISTYTVYYNPISNFLTVDKRNQDFQLVMNYIKNPNFQDDDVNMIYSFLKNSRMAKQWYDIFIPKLKLVMLETDGGDFENCSGLGMWSKITCNQIASAYLYLLAQNDRYDEFRKFIEDSRRNGWNELELKKVYLSKIYHYRSVQS